MATGYHEDGLSQTAKETHRAIASLCEEFEATDWYQQRADVTEDPELKAILIHNMNEELEHAAMTLEWLRRRIPKLHEELEEYLFTTDPIAHEDEERHDGGKRSEPADEGSLRIGGKRR